MTPERAQEILESRSPFGEISISAEEKKYVNGIWVRMPGSTSFYDALVRIAKGEAEHVKPMIGSATFYCGERYLTAVPVYLGEDPRGSIVSARARRSIEIVGHPATDPEHGCNALLSMFGNASLSFRELGA